MTIRTDKAHAYRKNLDEINQDQPETDRIRHINRKHQNNRIESNHAALKKDLNPMRGFQSLRTAKAENAQAMHFWVCLFGMLILSAFMVVSGQIGWEVMQPSLPTIEAWGWFAGLGVIARTTHMLAIRAFQLVPASVLAPFQYLKNMGATLLGAIIFGDLSDGLAGVGSQSSSASMFSTVNNRPTRRQYRWEGNE